MSPYCSLNDVFRCENEPYFTSKTLPIGLMQKRLRKKIKSYKIPVVSCFQLIKRKGFFSISYKLKQKIFMKMIFSSVKFWNQNAAKILHKRAKCAVAAIKIDQ